MSIEDKPLIAAHLGLVGEKQDIVTVTTADGSVVTMTEQPKPKFTLQDLNHRLTDCYSSLLKVMKNDTSEISAEARIKDACGHMQELVSIVSKHINDLEPIDIATDNAQAITTALETEKVCFFVTGVQLSENGKNVGTSLYSTVFKARKIRDILNTKFAELRVNHEAKLINYPVY